MWWIWRGEGYISLGSLNLNRTVEQNGFFMCIRRSRWIRQVKHTTVRPMKMFTNRYTLDFQPQPYNPAQMLPKNMCYDNKHLSKLYKYKLYPFCLNEVFFKMRYYSSFLLILTVCMGQWLDGKLKAMSTREWIDTVRGVQS